MGWLRRVSRDTLDRDLDRELRFHLEERIEALVANGVHRDEAYRRARAELSGIESVKEQCRDVWHVRWLDDLRSDVRISLRGLVRRPGFTATAALTLSIGIGATAAMFSVANAFLFRPFPAPDPEQLVVVAQRDEHTASPHRVSYPEYLDYRDRNLVFAGLAAYLLQREILSAGGASGPVWVDYVSPDFFEVLQVDAALGRTFLPDEGRLAGDAPVVVLSHHTWQHRFGADPSVVGRVVRLGTTELTVIGVTPESFTFTDTLLAPELYAPITQFGLVGAARGDPLTDRNRESFWLMGRLRAGVTVAEARVSLSVLTTALATEYPDSMEHSDLWVMDERRARPAPYLSSNMAPLMTMVMALASLVLLIACANVGTLLIGRNLGRQREMALRAGLGATRLRLARQLFSESALLALLGGAGGAVAAVWATDLLSAINFTGDGVIFDVQMDWRAFAFTAVAATLTGLIAGFAPALRASRVDLARAIGKSSRGPSRCATRQHLTSGLVVAQVTMSVVLLVCTGLFVRSGQHAVALDVGFRTDHLLLVSVDPIAQGYAPEQARGFYRDVADKVAALPDVRSVSWARWAPQTTEGTAIRVLTLDDGAIPETALSSLDANYVDPAFFDTLDIPVIRGRGFSDEEATVGRPVAVLSEMAAQQLWPDQDPLGQRFFDVNAPGRPLQVIGVVRDARLSTDITDISAVVLLPFGRNLAGSATLHVHTEGLPTALASAVTETMRRHDPTLVVYDVTSMDRHVYDGGILSLSRLGATVIGTFGALGLLLAAVGLYGLVAYSVSQRRQEFAIRTALGATAAGIVQLALGRGIILAVVGLALGVLAAYAVTPFTTGLLNVDPRDPLVFLATGLLLASVALLACLVPSRGATKADPLTALRIE